MALTAGGASAGAGGGGGPGVGGSLRGSVVKIFVRSVGSNFPSPWKKMPQQSGTGSGLCVATGGRQRVLTNAHVVGDAVSVRVRRHGDAVRHPAKVLCSHAQCDLALLEVESDEFWQGIAPIELTEVMPALDSDVLTIGYPLGGDNISVTRGVVSRVDLLDYTFSPIPGARLPVIQVDAAINPGNSGGPVLDPSGRAVGVAFARMQGAAKNIGYVIPGAVAIFFLRTYEATGSFGGLCSLGIRTQALQGSAIRRLHGLRGRGGVLVINVAPLSQTAAAGLCAGDVLLSVDGVPLEEDASVPFRDGAFGERIGFDFLVTRKAAGETLALGISRVSESAGESEPGSNEMTLEVPAAPLSPLVRNVDAQPSYLVVGGLVFVPLSLPWLEQRFQRLSDAPPELLSRIEEFKRYEDEEVVVLSKVLAAEVNYGYEDLACIQLIDFGAYGGASTSGGMVAIRSLRHLRELVTEARRPHAEHRYFKFRLANHIEVVLDVSECETAAAEILRQHAIPSDCSNDVGITEAVPEQLSRL